jgi:hypothetical protein
VRPSLAHLLVLSASQNVKFEFLVKSRVDQVKATMTYSMKLENKLDGASNFRAWKTRIDLILAKNKVLDIVKGKIMEPEFEERKEKEPQNIAVMKKFKDGDINAMSIIVDSIKDHLIPYISHLDSSKKMYDALTNFFLVRNIGLVVLKKNQGSVQKRKPQKKYDDQAFTARFKDFRKKRKFDSRKKPNQEKDMSEIQCFNYRKYGHYKNHCPKLKKRKETREASIVEEKEPSKKTMQDETNFFL